MAVAVLDELSVAEVDPRRRVGAPTDAALGQAVVVHPRVPPRIRQGLNVESGLNDGICVPLLFAAVAVADVESEISGGRSAATLPARRLTPTPGAVRASTTGDGVEIAPTA